MMVVMVVAAAMTMAGPTRSGRRHNVRSANHVTASRRPNEIAVVVMVRLMMVMWARSTVMMVTCGGRRRGSSRGDGRGCIAALRIGAARPTAAVVLVQVPTAAAAAHHAASGVVLAQVGAMQVGVLLEGALSVEILLVGLLVLVDGETGLKDDHCQQGGHATDASQPPETGLR